MENNDSQQVEQITVKNPKRVAAGKALAKKNKERKNQNQSTSSQSNLPSADLSTIYNGIQSTAGLVGAGFVLYHGWNFISSYKKNVLAPTSSQSTPTPHSTSSYPNPVSSTSSQSETSMAF